MNRRIVLCKLGGRPFSAYYRNVTLVRKARKTPRLNRVVLSREVGRIIAPPSGLKFFQRAFFVTVRRQPRRFRQESVDAVHAHRTAQF